MNTRPFILLLLCGCRNLVPGLPLPHRTHVATLADITPPGATPLPLQPMLKRQVQAKTIVAPPVFHRGVMWDYPANELPLVAFDVEVSTDSVNWQRIITTNQPPAYWDSINPMEYLRVGAHFTP